VICSTDSQSLSFFFFLYNILVQGTVNPEFIYNTEIHWNSYRCICGVGEQLATNKGQSRDSQFYVTMILLACTFIKIVIKNVFSTYSTT